LPTWAIVLIAIVGLPLTCGVARRCVGGKRSRDVAVKNQPTVEEKPTASASEDPGKRCPTGREWIEFDTGARHPCLGDASAGGPVAPFVQTLAALTINPRAIKPKVFRFNATENQDEYEYALSPFSYVRLSVPRANPKAWTADLKSAPNPEEWGTSGITHRCTRMNIGGEVIAEIYSIDAGPLAGTFVTKWSEGVVGLIGIEGLEEEKKSPDEKATPRELLCGER
jgi:hypothetical protein